MKKMKWVRRGVVVVVTALVVGAVAIGVSNEVENGKTTVTAMFANANTLEVGNTVRADGVDVGKVREITLQDGQARVTIEVDEQLTPVHSDASMRIRAVNVLGEKYVEFNPGSAGAPQLAESEVLPAKRTSVAVDVQDVIDGLKDPTATSLAALVTTGGEGLQGQGKKLRDMLAALKPAFTRAGELGRILSEQNDVLNQVLDRVQPVADAAADKDGRTMDQLVGSAQRTLETTAANREALDKTIAELPETIVSARRTLTKLTGTADATTPSLASVRPITDNLGSISGELDKLADVADPALASLRPVLDHADQLLDQAAPLVKQLRQGGPDLRGVAAGAKPIADELLQKNLKGVLDFVKLWAMSTNGEDGLSHYFRGVFIVTPQNVGDLANGAIKPKPTQPPAPPPSPNLSPPNLPLPLPGSSGKGKPRDPTNATGLSPQQEQSMLGQLLGGQ